MNAQVMLEELTQAQKLINYVMQQLSDQIVADSQPVVEDQPQVQPERRSVKSSETKSSDVDATKSSK